VLQPAQNLFDEARAEVGSDHDVDGSASLEQGMAPEEERTSRLVFSPHVHGEAPHVGEPRDAVAFIGRQACARLLLPAGERGSASSHWLTGYVILPAPTYE